MKNFKKIFALITVICMLASTMTVVFADTTTKYVTTAEKTTSTYTTETGNTGKFIMKYRVIDGTNDVLLTKVEATPNNATTGMDIVIPETIKDGDTTYNVVGTFGNVFTNSDKYSSVVMPDTITAVLGSNLFYNCKKLKSVKLSNNIDTTIAKGEYVIDGDTNISYVAGVFSGCTGLKEVTLPTGANFTKIPSNMFRGCQLDKLVIYDNVTYVPNDAFTQNTDSWGDAWVNNIYGNASSNGIVSKVLALVDGEPDVTQKVYATNFDTYDLGNGTCAVTGIKDGTNLYGLKGAVYMPEELNGKRVVAMMYDEGRYPFDSNQKDSAGRAKVTNTNAPQLIFNESNLTEFHMADTVEHIMYRKASDYASDYASNYVAVNADGSVKCEDPVNDETSTHYWYLFYGCSKLEKLHLSNNLKGRVRGLLRTANKLTEIEIPAGVTNISHCFRSQTTLKSIRFAPNSQLTKIESDTFKDTTGLEELVLPTQSAITTCKPNLNGTNTNLAIITTEANAAESSAVKTFANSKNIKVYTNLDANIISDTVVDGTGVTVTLRSRGLGYDAMPAGCKLVYAVYDADDTLAKVDIQEQADLDFSSSLVKTVDKNTGITVDEGQTVKVYAWTDLDNLVPVAQPAK